MKKAFIDYVCYENITKDTIKKFSKDNTPSSTLDTLVKIARRVDVHQQEAIRWARHLEKKAARLEEAIQSTRFVYNGTLDVLQRDLDIAKHNMDRITESSSTLSELIVFHLGIEALEWYRNEIDQRSCALSKILASKEIIAKLYELGRDMHDSTIHLLFRTVHFNYVDVYGDSDSVNWFTFNKENVAAIVDMYGQVLAYITPEGDLMALFNEDYVKIDEVDVKNFGIKEIASRIYNCEDQKDDKNEEVEKLQGQLKNVCSTLETIVKQWEVDKRSEDGRADFMYAWKNVHAKTIKKILEDLQVF